MVTGAKKHLFAVRPEADRYRRIAGERAEENAVGKTEQIEIVVIEDGDHFLVRREPRVVAQGFQFRSPRQVRKSPESSAGARPASGQQIPARAQSHGIVRAAVEAAHDLTGGGIPNPDVRFALGFSFPVVRRREAPIRGEENSRRLAAYR